MASLGNALTNWLERRWVAPAYAGGLLLGLALAFFGAAVNSMAGWRHAGDRPAQCLVNSAISQRTARSARAHSPRERRGTPHYHANAAKHHGPH